jgi:hypothetical protein
MDYVDKGTLAKIREPAWLTSERGTKSKKML